MSHIMPNYGYFIS